MMGGRAGREDDQMERDPVSLTHSLFQRETKVGPSRPVSSCKRGQLEASRKPLKQDKVGTVPPHLASPEAPLSCSGYLPRLRQPLPFHNTSFKAALTTSCGNEFHTLLSTGWNLGSRAFPSVSQMAVAEIPTRPTASEAHQGQQSIPQFNLWSP